MGQAGALSMRSVVPDWYEGVFSLPSLICVTYDYLIQHSMPQHAVGESLYQGVSTQDTLGPKGSREQFINAKGTKLASYKFPADSTPKGLVILVHGHGCRLVNLLRYVHLGM